jgi:hypothetical protein
MPSKQAGPPALDVRARRDVQGLGQGEGPSNSLALQRSRHFMKKHADRAGHKIPQHNRVSERTNACPHRQTPCWPLGLMAAITALAAGAGLMQRLACEGIIAGGSGQEAGIAAG